MADNKKTNKSVDLFGEYIRKRLKTHSIPPDENCWNEIETRLQIKKKRFPIRVSIAIAASVLTAVLLLHHMIINNKHETQYAFIENNDIPIQNPIAENAHTVITDKAGEKTEKQIENKTKGNFSEKQMVDNNPSVVTNGYKEETNEQEEATKDSVEEKNVEIQEKDKTKSTDLNKNEDLDKYQISENWLTYDLPTDKKRKKSWQINAGFGSGAGATNSSLNHFSGNEYLLDGGTGYNNNQSGNGTTSSITNIDYAIPISAGLTIRKKLNKTIGVETGLIYTYLSTDYDNSSHNPHRATLNLHYLGIPANLIVSLWDKQQWNFYLSGGGMVEKGLQAVYKQKNLASNNFQQDKNKSHISGLQWSLNGGIGISYRFYKDMNLYAEPVISYYFDCNQPLSKHTEDPLNFSIRAGIRYDF